MIGISKKIVIESPLSGDTPEDFQENFRYLLWCCRAAYLEGYQAIASHLVCPWFMNDRNPEERLAGIAWPWMWQGDPHFFYDDRGMSSGMNLAWARCKRDHIAFTKRSLKTHPELWDAYRRGEWPPGTEGFKLALVA